MTAARLQARHYSASCKHTTPECTLLKHEHLSNGKLQAGQCSVDPSREFERCQAMTAARLGIARQEEGQTRPQNCSNRAQSTADKCIKKCKHERQAQTLSLTCTSAKGRKMRGMRIRENSEMAVKMRAGVKAVGSAAP